ncbi:ATP-binding protein [Halorubrum xinjiangense]|uniref:ATP-binding protein n=1 Tax=Halorubrum xinjiangense TaxID=261291 RepID=UPI001CB6CB70|nr:PAS domain-containing sensor histidine kinase [Halorubrum xinjiangense]
MNDISIGLPVSGLNALPAELAILDSEGTIVLVNEAWERFADENYGRDPEYWVGDNYLEVTEQAGEGGAAGDVLEGLRTLLDGNTESFRVEYPCHSPTEQRWFIMYAAEFEHNGEQHVLVSHHNITDRKLAEMQSNARAEQLHSLFEVLTHDIRNPLNVIDGYTEMLAADLGDVDELNKIRRAAQRITEIMEATLEFTKTDALTEVESLELKEIAREGWKSVATTDATLSVISSKQILGDRRLLLQLFENLFRNAIEHAGNDCTVTVGPLGTGFYIEDNGSGIPQNIREKVTGADFSTRGTGGLGLPIVQSIVTAHGGNLLITESFEEGARFEITDMDVASDYPEHVANGG